MPIKAKEVNLTERPFLKKIILYIIPLILSGLLQCLYNAADLVIVGRFRGPGALAAVGTTGALTNLVLGLFMGLSVGAGVVVAQHIGALEYKRVSRVVHSAVALSFVLGIVMGIIGVIFSKTFLSLMGVVDSAEYSTLTQATLYLRIIFCGVPASFLYNYCASIVNATGETKKPLLILAISGVVNLILNVVLVGACGMGVEGVAIGTIAAQYLSALFILLYMRSLDNCIRFSFRKLCLDMESIKKMLVIGIPSGIQGTLFSLANVLIQSSINGFGDWVMAGNAAASNLEGFVYIAMNSVSKASLTFAGQNMGAKKYRNIKLILLQTTVCAAVIGLVMAGAILLFKEFFVGLYVSDEGISAEAYALSVDAAITRLYYILPVYFLCGIMEAFCGVIRGMGKSTVTMVFSLIGVCLLRIVWLETVFKYLLHTPEGVYLSYPVSWIVVITMDISYFVWFYRRLRREKTMEEYIDRLKN